MPLFIAAVARLEPFAPSFARRSTSLAPHHVASAADASAGCPLNECVRAVLRLRDSANRPLRAPSAVEEQESLSPEDRRTIAIYCEFLARVGEFRDRFASRHRAN